MLLAKILLWTARIVGGIVLLSLLFTVVPEMLRADPAKGEGLPDNRARLAFLCFPVLMLLGLALAYWKPGLGGTVSLVGMAAFFMLRPDLTGDPFMLALWIPGGLYVGYALCMRMAAE
ncbi:MAG TPA: hypothetical protein VGE21_09310 [Flavobacteriales bacterium]